MIKIVPYTDIFLNKSWGWLNDEEIKALTLTNNFTREQQQKWFASLPALHNYKIWGVQYDTEPIGACGLKNITQIDAEYWGYIGEKQFWSMGLGKKMLQAMIDEAKCLKLKELYLKVSIENVRAVNLYRKTGFIQEKAFGQNIQVMRLQL